MEERPAAGPKKPERSCDGRDARYALVRSVLRTPIQIDTAATLCERNSFAVSAAIRVLC